MRNLSRRRFLALAASTSAAMIVGFDPRARTWVTPARGAAGAWEQLPKLDGVLSLDEASREAMSVDAGMTFKRLPAAVLRPGSANDIVKMVQFANTHRLGIAMRGQGHSQYGQTLVEGGIVVDSRTLNAVRLVAPRTVDAQSGASWNQVTQATLAEGLMPPAMGNTMTLSVGGILSAGGLSNSSHLFGAVVDTVRELDVVSGDGRLVTCSQQRDAELFDMVLAGMGQCGLIVGARIELVAAPACAMRWDLHYDDFDAALLDTQRLATDGRFEHLGGYPEPRAGGALGFRIDAAKFCDSPDKADIAALTADLKLGSRSQPRELSFREYLQREAASNAAARAARAKDPRRGLFLAMFVPLGASRELIETILSTRSQASPLFRFGTHLLVNRKYARPLLKLPDGEFTMSLWPFRTVAYHDAAALAATQEANRRIVERMRALGGKAYPPYAPYLSSADWQAHYGTHTWQRVVAAKRKFDPNNVLTPGLGMFSA